MGPKTEKSFLVKSITKVRENDLVRFTKTFEIQFKFESLKIAYRMLRFRLLHLTFKASLLRDTLKTLTKLLTKLNRIYISYYVPKVFRNFFHRLRKRSVTFVTG